MDAESLAADSWAISSGAHLMVFGEDKLCASLSYGLEYQYGQREAQDGSTRDNHRIMFGIQVF